MHAVLCHRLTDHVFNLSICVVLCSVLSVSQSVLRKLCARVCVLFCTKNIFFFFTKLDVVERGTLRSSPTVLDVSQMLTNNSA